MTCNECIKYDACLAYNGGMTRIMSMDNKAEENCGHFKNKADFVEVVRCSECDVPHNKFTGCPNLNGLIPPPNYYCAGGERKKNDFKEEK